MHRHHITEGRCIFRAHPQVLRQILLVQTDRHRIDFIVPADLSYDFAQPGPARLPCPGTVGVGWFIAQIPAPKGGIASQGRRDLPDE